MSDFFSHLVSSALGTGRPVQPMFSPQAPAPEVAQAPELVLAPLAPPLAPRSAPRASSVPDSLPVPDSVPVPAPIPAPPPVFPGVEPPRSVGNPEASVEEEGSPPFAEGRRAEGRVTAPERPVALRHVLRPAPSASRGKGGADVDPDPEQGSDAGPATPASQPSSVPGRRLEEAPDHVSKRLEGPSNPPDRVKERYGGVGTGTSQSANGQSEGSNSPPAYAGVQVEASIRPPVQTNESLRSSPRTSAPADRTIDAEDDAVSRSRPAFTDPASKPDRQEAPSARPSFEPQRRLEQAPERRRTEREMSAPSASPPPVQIRIGRVEVRAVRPGPPAAAVPAPAPAPAAPATSLTDYLRKQRGRS